jgi:succinoglycan biosynthesis transport protein ExoP
MLEPNGADRNLPALAIERGVGDLRHLRPPDADEIHLRDYWEVLLRHRWTVLAFFVVVVASTLFMTLVAEPVYKATTLIEVKAEAQKLVAFQDVVQVAQVEREFYQTQYDVLRSRTLARRVIERLHLDHNAVFNPPDSGPSLVSRTLGLAHRLLTRATPHQAATADHLAEQGLVDRLLGAIDVSPRRNSYLVEVSFRSASPTLAADGANALADEYIGLALDQRIEAVQKGRAFIEKQLAVTKAALARSEEDLQTFARRNEILTIDSKQNIEYRKLTDLNQALTEAQHARIQKESLFNQVRKSDSGQLSEVVNNPVIAALAGELAKQEAERARLAETFTAEYPKVRRLDAQIGVLRRQIRGEQGVVASSLRADFEAARRQEALLSEALEGQKKVVTDLNQRAIDYKILKREVDTNRGIYNSLLQRLKEVEVTEGIKASNIHVVDKAEVPAAPYRPRPLLNLALAVVVGLLGGVGLAFFQEHLDNSIKSPEEVERYLRLPTLGVLPLLRGRRPNGQGASEVPPELVVVEDPKSMSAEALRTLRASLFLSTAAGPPQRILVTSARPQEGKTCVTANLAIVLAQMGRKVVLVDCDFRRPRVHRVFGFELERGATSFLAGGADLPSIIHHTSYGIDVVCGGPVPPNPVELIDSAPMVSLMDELSRRYDFVLLDAPPSLGFADVPLLSRVVGGVLFVVRAGQTPRKAAAAAADHLQRLRAKLLGVVLNGVRTGGPGYYSSYYGYYSYYRYDEDQRDAPSRTGEADRALEGPAVDA